MPCALIRPGESSSCSASRSAPLSQSAMGMPKPFFGPVGDARRQDVRHRALQQVLGVEASELEPGGHAAEELDQIDVQERRAHLERARHAGPIDLRQDVVLEIGLRIDVEQSFEAVRRRGVLEGAPLLLERVGRAAREERLLLGRT